MNKLQPNWWKYSPSW